ncbi:hypothetical protein MTO96_023743 [Rhipicephalus appendiculatus]
MSDVEEACKSVIAMCRSGRITRRQLPSEERRPTTLMKISRKSRRSVQSVALCLLPRVTMPVVRHIGLQLVEHCIKFRWNVMAIDDKHFIKDNVMKMMAEVRSLMLNH